MCVCVLLLKLKKDLKKILKMMIEKLDVIRDLRFHFLHVFFFCEDIWIYRDVA